MTQIEKNKMELWDDIQQLCDMPLNGERLTLLIHYMEGYDALCKVACLRSGHGDDGVEKSEAPRFDRHMAIAWTSGMVNADGTKGPRWNMEETTKVKEDHKVNCDPVLWWAVMNSLYSDYCEALKKNNASTLEIYVCLAKAWIHDADAVPDKAAAYYTYIVKH